MSKNALVVVKQGHQLLQRSPEPTDAELKACRELSEIVDDLEDTQLGFDWDSRAINRAKEFRSRLPKLKPIIAVQMAPATKADIAYEVAKLAEAFPLAGKRDLANFAALMCEDVDDKAPTVAGLRHAMKAIRRTSKFLPSIAEVMQRIDAENDGESDEEWSLFHSQLCWFELSIKGAEARLAREQAKAEAFERDVEEGRGA